MPTGHLREFVCAAWLEKKPWSFREEGGGFRDDAPSAPPSPPGIQRGTRVAPYRTRYDGNHSRSTLSLPSSSKSMHSKHQGLPATPQLSWLPREDFRL